MSGAQTKDERAAGFAYFRQQALLKERRARVVAYQVLRTDRAARPDWCPPVGALVYLGRDCYGCASDDTRITGIEHMSVCANESGQPFFTIPRDDLEPVYG